MSEPRDTCRFLSYGLRDLCFDLLNLPERMCVFVCMSLVCAFCVSSCLSARGV